MPIRPFEAKSFSPTSKFKLEIVFYESLNGSSPAAESLENLDEKLHKKVTAVLVNIAINGMDVLKSQSSYLRDDVSEIKHPRQTRVIWAGHGKGRIVVLSVDKKSPKKKIQTGQINKAITRLNQLRSE